MITKTDQPNIEMYCGILDIYQDDDITSFSMADPYRCRVKQRIDGEIAVAYDIPIV